jgi:hypothetical protein
VVTGRYGLAGGSDWRTEQRRGSVNSKVFIVPDSGSSWIGLTAKLWAAPYCPQAVPAQSVPVHSTWAVAWEVMSLKRDVWPKPLGVGAVGDEDDGRDANRNNSIVWNGAVSGDGVISENVEGHRINYPIRECTFNGDGGVRVVCAIAEATEGCSCSGTAVDAVLRELGVGRQMSVKAAVNAWLLSRFITAAGIVDWSKSHRLGEINWPAAGSGETSCRVVRGCAKYARFSFTESTDR